MQANDAWRASRVKEKGREKNDTEKRRGDLTQPPKDPYWSCKNAKIRSRYGVVRVIYK